MAALSSAAAAAALNVAELKEELRRRGLKLGGRKAELVERLLAAAGGDAATGERAESSGDGPARPISAAEEAPQAPTKRPSTSAETATSTAAGADGEPAAKRARSRREEPSPEAEQEAAATVPTDDPAGLLHAARDAAERRDLAALAALLSRTAFLLRKPPRPGGDGGPGITAEAIAELRTLKRTVLLCLEHLDLADEAAQASCGAALRHLHGLLAGAEISAAAKGGQQWLAIRDRVAPLVGAEVLRVSRCPNAG
eukprot:TRINITY_DN3900_c1_g1_i1.p1 TRINITY_DN3900_c1_g1~~TRINITY_DN3900_c1_g1_i1.p1  ORF type:complete len:282 (+),score=85.09 TRINITY_DN3900_c1_g1_i1:83-847(+)